MPSIPIRVARPRLLVALVILGMIAASLATIVIADESEPQPEYSPLPVAPEPTLDESQRADAEEFLASNSEQLDRVTQGQPWSVVSAAPSLRLGEVVGAKLSVVWDTPVSSRGPWTSLKCRGTRQFEHDALWHSVRSASIVISLGDDPEVLEFIPARVHLPSGGIVGDEADFDGEYAAEDSRLTIRDVRTGEIVESLGPGVIDDDVPPCPEGANDD